MSRPTFEDVAREVVRRRHLVLETVRDRGPLTFAQIMEATGLNRGAVVHAVTEDQTPAGKTWRAT